MERQNTVIVTTAHVISARRLDRNVDVTMFAAKDWSAYLAVVERSSNGATTCHDVRKISIVRKDCVVPKAMESLYVNQC